MLEKLLDIIALFVRKTGSGRLGSFSLFGAMFTTGVSALVIGLSWTDDFLWRFNNLFNIRDTWSSYCSSSTASLESMFSEVLTFTLEANNYCQNWSNPCVSSGEKSWIESSINFFFCKNWFLMATLLNFIKIFYNQCPEGWDRKIPTHPRVIICFFVFKT